MSLFLTFNEAFQYYVTRLTIYTIAFSVLHHNMADVHVIK